MASSARLISQWTKFEIAKVFKQARRCLKHSGLDILLYPKMHEVGRLLVVTPGKIGNAVHRNRVRRRLKSLFYEGKFMDKAFDCIIIVKKDGISLDYDQLNELLLKAYQNSQNLPQSYENRS
jgi:ribonuclease P protein component